MADVAFDPILCSLRFSYDTAPNPKAVSTNLQNECRILRGSVFHVGRVTLPTACSRLREQSASLVSSLKHSFRERYSEALSTEGSIGVTFSSIILVNNPEYTRT